MPLTKDFRSLGAEWVESRRDRPGTSSSRSWQPIKRTSSLPVMAADLPSKWDEDEADVGASPVCPRAPLSVFERLQTDVAAATRRCRTRHRVRFQLLLQFHGLGRLLWRQFLVAQFQRVTDQVQPLARLGQTRLSLKTKQNEKRITWMSIPSNFKWRHCLFRMK